MTENTNRASARDAITNLLCLYVHAIDRRQWGLLENVFFEDALCGIGVEALPWRTWRETSRKNFSTCLDHTHHQLSPTLINLQGNVAWCETYCTAHHRVRADAPSEGRFQGTGEPYDIISGLRYSDRFELRDGVWRIAVRQGLVDWRRRRAAQDALYAAPEFRGLHQKEAATDQVVAPWVVG